MTNNVFCADMDYMVNDKPDNMKMWKSGQHCQRNNE